MRPRRLFMIATVFALVAGCYQLIADARRTFTWDLKSGKQGPKAHADFKASLELGNKWQIFFSVHRKDKEAEALPIARKKAVPIRTAKKLPRRRPAVAQR